ncbi:hypothetical protein [Ancylobacter terrae]|uniref:hypothetical protein n=1 Tax=Ancylobacter sp. sgz301288 TaxID=3342077 RepID=UPI00385CB4C1
MLQVRSQWTHGVVKDRLAAAIALTESTVSRPGPQGIRSAWPEVRPDSRDIWWQRETLHDHAGRRNAWRIGATADEIQDAEEALAWLGLVRWERHRRALQLWCRARAGRIPFRDIATTDAASYPTLKRHLREAFDTIADALNRADRIGRSNASSDLHQQY